MSAVPRIMSLCALVTAGLQELSVTESLLQEMPGSQV
jgi:hypothetical protein